MKRLYIYLLGALAVVSCAKVAPEVPDGEQNQSEQDELEVVAQGWDHETTCRESFTEERLDWVFENN